MNWRTKLGLSVAFLCGLGITVLMWPRPESLSPSLPTSRETYQRWARSEFIRRHPGEKPLNWRIAETAERFHRLKPMGPFVPGSNDSSDFVACIVDEAVGVGARFNRRSVDHLLGERSDLYDSWYWYPGMVVQPGDLLSVQHSPWYPPHKKAQWHLGVVGVHGYVYDFVKLAGWRHPRYGRNPFEWFVRYSRGPDQVQVRRLKAKYRYLIEPLPHPTTDHSPTQVSPSSHLR